MTMSRNDLAAHEYGRKSTAGDIMAAHLEAVVATPQGVLFGRIQLAQSLLDAAERAEGLPATRALIGEARLALGGSTIEQIAAARAAGHR